MSSVLYCRQDYIKHLDRINCFGRRRMIFKKILSYLKPVPEDRILEVGCSQGKTLIKMKKYSQNVTGIDFSSLAIKNAVTSGVMEMDGSEMSFQSNYFDKVYSSHTIEHVPDPSKFIKEIERVVRPGGKVLLIYPFEIIRGCLTLTDAIFIYRNPLMARKLHLHRFTPKKIQQLIRGTSLQHKKSGLHFVPFFSYFSLLEKRTCDSVVE